jgi:hypothetical protein
VSTQEALTTLPSVSSSSPALLSPANDDQALSGDGGHEDDDAQNHQTNPEPQPEETSTDQHPATPAVVPPVAEPPDLTTAANDNQPADLPATGTE